MCSFRITVCKLLFGEKVRQQFHCALVRVLFLLQYLLYSTFLLRLNTVVYQFFINSDWGAGGRLLLCWSMYIYLHCWRTGFVFTRGCPWRACIGGGKVAGIERSERQIVEHWWIILIVMISRIRRLKKKQWFSISLKLYCVCTLTNNLFTRVYVYHNALQ